MTRSRPLTICEDHGGMGGVYVARRGQGRTAEQVVLYCCPQCRIEVDRGKRAAAVEDKLW